MTLKAELRAMADAIALPDSDLHKRIESALHAVVKRVLEEEPTRNIEQEGRWRALEPDIKANLTLADCAKIYRAMAAQLLREIENGESNAPPVV